jgi:hypothetical protein
MGVYEKVLIHALFYVFEEFSIIVREIDSAVNNFAQNVNLSLVTRMHYLAKRLEPLSL